MREITDHKVNGLNDSIILSTLDGPGAGGANHKYRFDLISGAPSSGGYELTVHFQNGPILEAGYNGFSNESFLAMLIDRMRGFQFQRNEDGSFNFKAPGQFACKENAVALTHLEEALMWLQKRTRDRMSRGVEGTHKV